MLAWRLWWALNSPLVRHPVFRRTLHGSGSDSALMRQLSNALMAVTWLLLCPLACAVPLLAVCLFLALPGAKLATKVGAAIAKDQSRGVNDFLGVTPHGNMGVAWIICTAFRDGRPPDFFMTRDEFIAIGFFCCMSTLAFGVAGFALFIVGAIVLVVAYFDFAQSLVMGSIVGIWSAHAGTRLDARIQAVALYVGLQIMVYAPAILLSFFLMSFSLGKTTPEAVLKLIMVIIAFTCTLLALRESMIVVLWHSILKILNADYKDLASATYGTK